MRTVEPDDLAELFPGPGIHHDDSVLMRDEQAMTDRVEREVVPPAVAGQLVRMGDVIGLSPSAIRDADCQTEDGREDVTRGVHKGSVPNCDGDMCSDRANSTPALRYAASGNVSVTRVPAPGCESMAMRAPCESAIHWAIARPRPAPSASWRAGSPR